MVTQQLTTTADDNELVLAEELGLRHVREGVHAVLEPDAP